jgi:nucleotide-binding universal stress UspA family protein
MTDNERPYVIMVALQFDETGVCALEEAVRIARGLPNVELHALHSVAPSFAAELSGDLASRSAQTARAPQRLEELIDRACAGTSLAVKGHIRAGTSVDAILKTASEVDADLIVVGSHRRRGLEKLVLGSVAERILHEARCPVMLAVPKAWKAASSVEPPCAECVALRTQTGDGSRWCERHSRPRMRAHVYVPSDAPPKTMSGG